MIDPVSLRGTGGQVTPEVKRLVDVFMSPEGIGRRYLFGRNEHSTALSKVIDIDGFVDDFSGQGTIWNGKPVVNGNAVPKSAIVVNCVMCNMPVTAAKRIQKLGIFGALAYSDLCYALPGLVPVPNFVSETRSDHCQNLKEWQTLSLSLADDQSRQILDDLLSFRLTGNYASMTPYSFRPRDQYFEDFLELGSKEIFVDAGGFDGDTTELFVDRYPDYEKIYLFEPSLSNLAKARIRLNGCRAVEFVHLGLSDTEGKVSFNPDGGSASSISSSGPCQIDVITLDRQIHGRVTFIKMDLEGWEIKALQGAKLHIVEEHPTLAIAVYHHPSDFRVCYWLKAGLQGIPAALYGRLE
jgi:FkbM family methyltransferase